MTLVQDIYKELILEHARHPSHLGHLHDATVSQANVNRSCGDEVEVELRISEDRIDAIRVNSKGCSISLASGSMMAEAVEGMTRQEAKQLIETFKSMLLQGTKPVFPPKGEDLEALSGVSKYPIRIKCATLAWSTLEQALKQTEE